MAYHIPNAAGPHSSARARCFVATAHSSAGVGLSQRCDHVISRPLERSPAPSGELADAADRRAAGQEATEKLGATIEIDVLSPLQAFDQGGSARAVTALIQGLAAAKEAGISDAALAGIFAKMAGGRPLARGASGAAGTCSWGRRALGTLTFSKAAASSWVVDTSIDVSLL